MVSSFETRHSTKLRALFAVAALISLALLCRMLLVADRGFDLTDEGFYLLSMERPERYEFTSTLFGYVLHPLYQGVGGSVAALRVANIVLTFGTCGLFFETLFVTTGISTQLTRWERLFAVTAFASSALVLFDLWILTPSYNSLALQGIFLAVSCGLRAGGRRSLAWLVGLGVGGWLVFMAKPPAALLLGLAMLLQLRQHTPRFWSAVFTAGGVAFGLLLWTAFALAGGPVAFIEQLATAARLVSGVDHSIAQLFDFGPPSMGRMDLLMVAAALLFGWVMPMLKPMLGAGSVRFYALFAAPLLSALVCVVSGERWISQSGALAALLLLPLAATAGWMLIHGRARHPAEAVSTLLPQQHRLSIVLFCVMPFVFAFGTNNNLWMWMGHAGAFWVGAAVLLGAGSNDPESSRERLLVTGSLTVAVAAALTMSAMRVPHRLGGPVDAQTELLRVRGSDLRVLPKTALFLRSAIEASSAAGLEQGRFVMDLTGGSPGLVYAIGGASFGLPWFIGGYTESDEALQRLSREMSCDTLAEAWLLVEPNGSRSIDVSRILGPIGAELAADYAAVTHLPDAPPNGGLLPRGEVVLYRPTRPAELAARACTEQRSRTSE